MDEIIQEFLVESHENLDQLDRDFVELEQSPDSREQLASVFRTIHTIKGTSGFLAFGNLERVTHVGENLLAKLRDGDRRLDGPTTDILLRMVDAVRACLTEIEATGVDATTDVSGVVADVKALLEAPAAAAPEAAAEPVSEPVPQPVTEPVTGSAPAEVPASAPAVVKPRSRSRKTPARRAATEPAAAEPAGTEPAAAPEPVAVEQAPAAGAGRPAAARAASAEPADALGKLLVDAGLCTTQQVGHAVNLQSNGDERALGEILVDLGLVTEEALQTLLAQQPPKKRSAVDGSIRVDVDLLENLMQLVGELVLSRNQILAHAADGEDATLVRSAHRLDLISSSLQEAVMKTRMQPMDYLWAKLPRIVRDLAAQCGKEVDLVMVGRETELDRTLLDAVKDPLTHLVRNSVDHGIETPEERVAAGKSPRGTLSLRAYHESGQVVMEIGDDGKGVDPDRVGRKAVDKGLITDGELAGMTRAEVTNLIFRAGFSTAETVTNVSGRGVGMDVVRTNIEKIGGTVDLASTPGHGTVIRVTIPLTLAIIPALIVRQGDERYAIPQANLLELVRMDTEDPTKGVEYVAGVPVHRLRGKLLPLLDLSEQLGVASLRRGENANIAVLRSDSTEFGLVVDEVLETQEIVVKPLGAALTSIPALSGAAIMGDGRIALILDVVGLAGTGRVAGSQASLSAALREERGIAELREDLTSLLVVRTDGGRNVAIPLETVSRLEETDASNLERVGSTAVMQYRGGLLPVVEIDYGSSDWGVPHQGDAPLEESTSVRIVVHQAGDQLVGLRVDEILDIVEVPLVLSQVGARSGSLGSLVINGHITDVLDVAALVAPLENSYVH